MVAYFPALGEGGADIGARKDRVAGIFAIETVVRPGADRADFHAGRDVVLELLVEPADGEAAGVLEIILQREIPVGRPRRLQIRIAEVTVSLGY
jgi:hypothetical protein